MFWSNLLTFLLALVGVLLMFVILLQRGRGGGLAGAFGGLGGQSAFGTKAGDVFTRITIGMAIVWFALAATTLYAMRWETQGRFKGSPDAVPAEPAVGKPDDGKDDDAKANDIFKNIELDKGKSETESDKSGGPIIPGADDKGAPTKESSKTEEKKQGTAPAESKPAESKPAETPKPDEKASDKK